MRRRRQAPQAKPYWKHLNPEPSGFFFMNQIRNSRFAASKDYSIYLAKGTSDCQGILVVDAFNATCTDECRAHSCHSSTVLSDRPPYRTVFSLLAHGLRSPLFVLPVRQCGGMTRRRVRLRSQIYPGLQRRSTMLVRAPVVGKRLIALVLLGATLILFRSCAPHPRCTGGNEFVAQAIQNPTQ
ncbi:hypothetical protein BJY52DRAFT_785695 [Lactarius psammicola]|nr:hypothetical protein BJY52DRAFT_785695 [Lactarius psammicola]